MPTAPDNLPEFFPSSVVVTTPADEPGGDVTLTWNAVDKYTDGANVQVQLNAGNWELVNTDDPTAPFTLGVEADNPFFATIWSTNGYTVGVQTFPRSELFDATQTVANDLATQSFSLSYTTTRASHPDFDLSKGETKTTQVVCAPGLYTVAGETRSTFDERHFVDVGVLRRFSQQLTGETAKLSREHQADSLSSLVQEIVDHMYGRTLALTPTLSMTCLGVEVIQFANPEHWEENGQFTSVTRYEFKASRAKP